MYKYVCRDLGVECDFSTTAESPEDVKKAVSAHTDVVHKEMLQSMTPEQLANWENSVDEAIKLA